MKIQHLVLCLIISLQSLADNEKKEVTWGGFLDTYYGFDFNEPSGDRSFTTQAVRHNEFAINLAYLEAKVQKENLHGRVALQAGTSVYANYAGENRTGTNRALADILQHIQEAYGGFQVAPDFWIDAGIYFSHIGSEGFISKDNWNYTRSLSADYSPYYQTGIRATYQISPKWSAQLHLINGWQNIIETNSDKAVGFQLSYALSDAVTITYNNFLGRETQFRILNDLIVRMQISKVLSLCLTSDFGLQKKPGEAGYSNWFSETLTTRLRLIGNLSLGGRIEYFQDKDQVLVTVANPNGFQAYGASLNLDWESGTGFIFRNEVRSLFSKNAIFTSKNGLKNYNFIALTSLAYSF